jgi:arsenate reductase (thioredoxin)
MKYVLFVCTHNAGRSQIAQAFFERDAPADIHAESAGEEPATAIWPNVIEAMRELGIDISQRRPKKLDLEMQLHADWAITLHCKASCPFVPSQVEDWDVDDPAGQPLERVREIRDEIEQRVHDFVQTRLDDVRSGETAHRLRLQKLIPSLVEEFGDEKPAEEIRTCADAVLAEFADVPVRSFVLTLAHRRARECLRDGSCAALVAAV